MNTQVRQGETRKPLGAWLAEHGPLNQQELAGILRELALQLVALHDQGRIHANLVAGEIGITDAGQPRLIAATSELPDFIELSPELAPPEIRAQVAGKLPRGLAAASQALSAAGVAFDARRIDVYQLGALTVQLAAGVSAEDYLQSPGAAAKIPTALRRVVDRALGISPAQRLATCTQLLAELDVEVAIVPTVQTEARETPSRGVAISSDTDVLKKQREQARRQRETGELPFERLGIYEIVARLGSGGMGDVFKGYDASLDRFVAIKVLPREFAQQEEFVGRFRAEAAAAAKVEHPNIVPIYTIGSEQDRHFFAMQFVDGQTLGQLLAQQPRLSPEQTLKIVEQVVSGLAAAHRFGLVHRDIKPGNILLADGGRRALVADFGLVKSIGQSNQMTATGVVMGTVDYISPEQGRGKTVDGRSDLYSIGVLLYQMLAGKLPFSADTPTAMIFQHAYEPPPPLIEAAPQTPPLLAQIVHRLLAKAPAERYQTCEDLLDDLVAFRCGQVPPHLSGAVAARETGPRTAIILAPKFVEHDLPPVPETEPAIALAKHWSWEYAKQYVFFWLKQKAPELVRRLENTQQQVDGAVFEYEQRCETLGRLVSEAQAVQRLLEIQLKEHTAAAAIARKRKGIAQDDETLEEATAQCVSNETAAAQLQQQVLQQGEELEAMQLEFAKTSARLTNLRTQRDALRARLKVAQARYSHSDGRQRQSRRSLAIASAAALSAALLFAVGIWIWRNPRVGTTKAGVDPKESGKEQDDAIVPETFALDHPPQHITLELDSAAQTTTINETIEAMQWMSNPNTTASCNLAIGGASGGIWDIYVYQGRLATTADRWSTHNNAVTDLAFSRQSQRLATAGKDGNIFIWDREPRRLARRLAQGEEVTAVSFSPLGDQLLAGGRSGVRCWDVVSGEEMQRYADLGFNWSSEAGLAWFPNQSAFLLATNTSGSSASAFVVPTDGSARRELPASVTRLRHVAIFRGGEMIVGQSHNDICVWDSRNSMAPRMFGSKVRCAAYSQWGGHTLTGHADGSVVVWDTLTGQKLQDVVKLPAEVTEVAMTSRGDLGAASCGRDISTLRIFPLPKEKVAGLKRYFQVPKTLRALAFSPYELKVASQDEQNVRVWTLEADETTQGSVEALPGSSVTYSPDGQRLLITRSQPDRQGNGPITLALPRQGLTGGNAQLRRYSGHQGGTNAAAFLHSGSKFVSGGNDSELRIWDVATEKELQHFNVGTPVRALALSRDQTQVFAAGDLLDVQVWNLETQTSSGALTGHSLPVSAVMVAKIADRVVTISGDKTARVWDSKTLQCLASFELSAVPRVVAISPDGSRVVTGDMDGVIRSWDVAGKMGGPVLGVHNGSVTALCLSLDGQSLVSAGEDQLLCWWTIPKK